jgi:hypothetical protein
LRFQILKPEPIVRSYFFYINDSRYSVPTLLVVNARGDDHCLTQAREYLLRSPHYEAIEVVDGEREVGRVER